MDFSDTGNPFRLMGFQSAQAIVGGEKLRPMNFSKYWDLLGRMFRRSAGPVYKRLLCLTDSLRG